MQGTTTLRNNTSFFQIRMKAYKYTLWTEHRIFEC